MRQPCSKSSLAFRVFVTMRLFLAALLPALAFGKIIKLCFKRFTIFKCCSDHFLEQSFANVDAPQLLCPTPSCSCPSGNCSHAHSWSGSGCCQAQAGAPLFAPAHSLLLNFRPIAWQGHFSFFTGCKSSSSSSEPAAGPDNGRGRVF